MTSIGGDVASTLADRYRIERELGQGGTATVYLAEDLMHKRKIGGSAMGGELTGS